MKAAEEGNELIATGVIAGHLDGGFDGLGAGVSEIHAARIVTGSEAGEAFREVDHVLVIEVRAGHVNQLRGLALDGIDDLRMTVAGGDHGDAGVSIEKAIAIDIDDYGSLAAVDHQRVRARV